MRNWKYFLAILFIFLISPINISAKEKINVYIFEGDGCPYCEAAFEFFDSIKDEYEQYYTLVDYEVWNDQANANLHQKVAKYLGEEAGGVPYIVIGKTTFRGYDESFNQDIINAIMNEYNNNDYVDAVVEAKKMPDTPDTNYAVILVFLVIVGIFVAFLCYGKKSQTKL